MGQPTSKFDVWEQWTRGEGKRVYVADHYCANCAEIVAAELAAIGTN